MAFKDAFSAEDWARVIAAPMLAGIAVTAADPGGLWGALKESIATAGALREAKGSGEAAGLVDEIVSAYETAEGRALARGVLKDEAQGRKPAEIVDAAVDELAAISQLVRAHAPEAAPGFVAWIGEVAQRVAEAGTEGGFLGFGGVKVSDAERATIARLSRALA
jgi:hypothetical protein